MKNYVNRSFINALHADLMMAIVAAKLAQIFVIKDTKSCQLELLMDSAIAELVRSVIAYYANA